MAWVQIGPHKINTALLCYVDQEGDMLRLFFQGRWQGNPLELHFDEAKALWKYLKAENPMGPREKGSTVVLPRAHSAKVMELPPAQTGGEPEKPSPSNASRAGSHGHHKPSHSHSGTSSSHHHRTSEPAKVPVLKAS